MQAELRASEAKFAGILSIAADAIISVDQTQRIVHFNRGAEEIFGYTAQDAIGRHLNILLPPRFRAAHPTHMEGFAQSAVTARRRKWYRTTARQSPRWPPRNCPPRP